MFEGFRVSCSRDEFNFNREILPSFLFGDVNEFFFLSAVPPDMQTALFE